MPLGDHEAAVLLELEWGEANEAVLDRAGQQEQERGTSAPPVVPCPSSLLPEQGVFSLSTAQAL